MVGVMLVVYARRRLAAAGAVRVDFCDSWGVGLMGAAGNKVRAAGLRGPWQADTAPVLINATRATRRARAVHARLRLDHPERLRLDHPACAVYCARARALARGGYALASLRSGVLIVVLRVLARTRVQGGVAASLSVYETKLCLVSAHLAAHDRQARVREREERERERERERKRERERERREFAPPKSPLSCMRSCISACTMELPHQCVYLQP